jgi:hypothetical protein
MKYTRKKYNGISLHIPKLQRCSKDNSYVTIRFDPKSKKLQYICLKCGFSEDVLEERINYAYAFKLQYRIVNGEKHDIIYDDSGNEIGFTVDKNYVPKYYMSKANQLKRKKEKNEKNI